MKDSTITVRVDAELKTEAEQACEFLGITLTSAVHRALRQVILESHDVARLLERARHYKKSDGMDVIRLMHCMSDDERRDLIEFLGGRYRG